MATPINYLKNVTKSIMYSAVDYSAEFAPEIHDFLDTNKDALVTTYAALKNPVATTKKAISAFQQSKVYKAIDYGTKNVFEDLRSGKFYNKERNERDEMRLAGMNLDDWDDLSEFGVENGPKDKASSDSSSEITAGDRKVADSVESSVAASTNTIVNATITSAEASIKTSKINTAMLYNQNEKLFGRLHSDVGVVNNTMNKIMELQSAAFTNIDKNISSFFSEQSKLNAERNNLLKQLVEFQSKAYTSAAEKEKAERDKYNAKKKKKFRWSDVNVSGTPDLGNYWQAIQKNIAGEIESLGIPGFSEEGNMLAAMFTSPLRGISDYIVKGLVPATIKDITKELSTSVSNLFANAIAELARNKDKDNVLSLVARIFGINTGVNKNIDTSKYERGPVPFDGLTRKAIIDVIPTYLRRIDATLAGRPETMFDYGSGKWVNAKDVEKQYNAIRKNAINAGAQDIDRATASARKFVKTASKNEAKQFDDAWEEFKAYLYDNYGRFDVRKTASQNKIDSSRYPNFVRNYELIRTIYKNSAIYREAGGKQRTRYSMYSSGAAASLRAHDQEEKAYRDIENSEANIIKQIMAEGGFSNVDKGKWKLVEGTKDNYKFKAFNNIAEYKDEFGNTLYNYLQNINKELIWQRDNWLMGSILRIRRNRNRSNSGNSSGSPNQLTDINSITLRRNSSTYSSNNGDTSTEANNAAAAGNGVIYADLVEAMNNAVEEGIDINDPSFRALADMIINQNTEEYNAKVRSEVNDSGLSKLMNQLLYGQKYATKDMVRSAKAKAEKDTDKDEETSKTGIIARIKKAIDDYGTLSRAIGGASLEAFRNVLYSVDKSIYEMMYHTELKDDEDKDKYDGFIGFLTGKISKAFKGIADRFKEDVIDPFREKLGIGEDFEDRFKGAFVNDLAFLANTFLNANIETYKPIANYAKGKYEATKEKLTAPARIKENAAKMGYVQEYGAWKRNTKIIKRNRRYRDRLNMALNSNELSQDEMYDYLHSLSEDKLVGKLEEVGIDADRIEAIKANTKGGARKEAYIKAYLRHELATHARGTFGLPYAGDTMLSKGELLFNEDGVGMVNKTGAYRINKPTHILNSPDSHDLLSSLGVTGLGRKSTIQQDISNENALKGKFKGIDNNADGNIQISGAGRFDTDAMVAEAKKQLPETLAGGVVGAIASSLLGVAGGPLLGLLFGGATSLVAGSEDLKNMLFGKVVDKDSGERDNSGFISKAVIDSVKRYAPDVLKFGLAGILPGIITGLGPIPGLLVGGAIGFLKNNEAFTNKYFGKDGKLTIKSREKQIIDEYAPKALKGAALGAAVGIIFGGPFGILGNAAVGSALNMMGGAEAFKTMLLGEEINGERTGGVMNAILDAFQPIVDAGLTFKDKLLSAIDNNIVDPLSRFLQPAINAIPQVMSFIPRMLNNFLQKYYGASIGEIAKRVLSPVSWLGSTAIKAGGALLSPLTMPFRLVGKAGDMIRGQQIKTMNADYMTASERINWLEENGKGNQVTDFDRLLASSNSPEALEKMKRIKTNLNAFTDNATDLQKKEKAQFKKIRGALEGFKTESGKSLSADTQRKAREAIERGDIGQVASILRGAGLTESDFNSLMSAEGINLKDMMVNYKDLRTRKDNLNSMDQNEALKAAQEELRKLGVKSDITDPHEAQKILKYLDTEITNREAYPEELTTIGLQSETNEILGKIADYLGATKDSAVGANSEFVNDLIRATRQQAVNDIDESIEENYKEYGNTAAKNAGKFYANASEEQADAEFSNETINRFSSADSSPKKIAKAAKLGVSVEDFNIAKGDENLAMRIGKVKKIIGNKIDKSGKERIVALSKFDYKTFYKRIKKLGHVARFYANKDSKPMSADDVNEVCRLNDREFFRVFANKLTKVIQNGLIAKYPTIVAVSAVKDANKLNYETAPGTAADNTTEAVENVIEDISPQLPAIIKNPEAVIDNTPVDESNVIDVDYQEIPNHGIGTFLLGLGGKALGGLAGLGMKAAGKVIGGIGSLGKDLKTGISDSVKDIGSALSNKLFGDDADGEIVTSGAGAQYRMTDDGPIKYEQSSDGSFKEDTTDADTRTTMMKINKRKSLAEKLQEAQLKTSEFFNKLIDDSDSMGETNDRKMSLLSLLLTGGILYKTGILGKVYTAIVKPAWEKVIVPWWQKKAAPWITDRLINIRDWISDKAIPWITEQLPNMIATVVATTIQNLGPILIGIAKGMVWALDKTLTTKDQQNAVERGIITEDQVTSTNFGDTSVGRVAGKLGNAAVHAFVKGGAGGLVNATYKIANFATRHGGIPGKLAGYTTEAALKPSKVAGKAGSKFAESIVYNSLMRTAKAGGEGAAKAYTMVANHAYDMATAAGEASTKGGIVAKILNKLKKLALDGIDNLLKSPKVQNVLANLAASGLGKSVTNLKNKLVSLFDDALVKGCEKLGVQTVKEAAKKLNIILTVAMLVVDFTVGMDQAESILGIEDPNLVEAFTAGICNALCNLLILPALWPGIPWIAQNILEFFGDDLEARQKEADKAYEEYVKETGDNISKETYLKEQHSVTGKIGRFFRKDVMGALTGNGKNNKGEEQENHSLVAGVKAIPDTLKDLGETIKTGDFKKLMEFKLLDTDSPWAIPINALFSIGGKTMFLIPTAIGGIITHFDGITKGLESTGKEILEAAPKILKAAFTGDFEEFFKPITVKVNEEENPIASMAANLVISIERSFLTVPMLATGVVRKVYEGIKNIATVATDAYTNAKQQAKDVIDGKADIFTKDYWKPIDNNDGFEWLVSNVTNYLYKIISLPETIFKRVINDTVGANSMLGKLAKKVAEYLGLDFGKDKDDDKSDSDTESGKGTLYGRGYSKQIDPSIAGIRFNARGDSEYQTIGDSACGPVAAVNALESFGRGKAALDASRFALSGGYKETNGGTRPEFFGDYFASQGYGSNLMTSKSQLANSIYSGNPTVLMGKDARGTSGYSPYGKTPHYITVTGTDGRGNAIVQDPESRYDNQLYPMSSLLSKSSFGVSAYGMGKSRTWKKAWPKMRRTLRYGKGNDDILPSAGVAKYIDGSSNDSILPTAGAARYLDSNKNTGVTNVTWEGTKPATVVNWDGITPSTVVGWDNGSEVANVELPPGITPEQGMVWKFLLDHGFNEYAAAGLMGCWQEESSNSPNRIEGDYYFKEDPKTVISSPDYMDSYTKKVFDLHKVSAKAQQYYLGSDGHYYPGLGLAQWTGPRHEALRNYAQSKGEDQLSIGSQLEYFMTELNGKKSGYNAAKDTVDSVESGTIAALDKYEMRDGWHTTSKGQSQLQKRLAHANTIYNALTGHPGIGISGISGGVSSSSKTTTSSVDQNSINPSSGDSSSGSIGDLAGSFLDILANTWKMSNIGKAFNLIFGGDKSNTSAPVSKADPEDERSNDSDEYKAGVSTGAVGEITNYEFDNTGDTEMIHGYPYFNQGDSKWATHPYVNGTIKSSGCGPTSMAMVLRGYGHNVTPINTIDWAAQHNFKDPEKGTRWGFFPAIGNEFGIETIDLKTNFGDIPGYLNQGYPVIASAKHGDFTSGTGHFIVFPPNGIKGNNLFVNDPGSRKNTQSDWQFDKVTPQLKNAWAFIGEKVNNGNNNVTQVTWDNTTPTATNGVTNVTWDNQGTNNSVTNVTWDNQVASAGEAKYTNGSNNDSILPTAGAAKYLGKGGNKNKPMSVYGTYRNNLNSGRGSNIRSIGSRRYGRAAMTGQTNTSNAELVAIVKALVTIADNTDKLNIIVNILTERLGVQVSAEDIQKAKESASTRDQLINQLNSTGFNGISNAFDQASNSSLESVMAAANRIASE